MIRALSFLPLCFFGLAGPLWVFLPAAALYGLYFSGLELIILGAAIDVFFGGVPHHIPWYTCLAIGWLICVEFVKPYLVLYNQTE